MSRTAWSSRLCMLTMVSGLILLLASLATGTAHQARAASPRQHVPDIRFAVPTRRACAVPPPGRVSCLSLLRTDVPARTGLLREAPAGLGPADLRGAYRLPSASAGRGATVALIVAADAPNAEADLAIYRAQYGLRPCTTANGCLRKTDETGGSSFPPAEAGWSEEASLDLDMVSAACPNCRLLLVEAAQPNMTNLGRAVGTAVRLGAKFVSNSYGGDERTEARARADADFDHPGVAIAAAAGDNGYGVLFPASAPYVTAVGGTSLLRSANARGWSESAWSGSGSGCSAYFGKPAWQKDSGCPRRTVADVAAVADPATGVAVYDSYGMGGWLVVGGTSAATPLVTSAYALAGKAPAGSRPAGFPYARAGDLNDITTGSNGTCEPAYLCTARVGYDGPTGFGTPDGVTAFRSGTMAVAKSTTHHVRTRAGHRSSMRPTPTRPAHVRGTSGSAGYTARPASRADPPHVGTAYRPASPRPPAGRGAEPWLPPNGRPRAAALGPLGLGPAALGPVTGGPVTGGPVTGGPVTGDPVTGDPVTGDPVTGDPVTGDPVTGDPVTGDPVTGDPVTGDPVTGDPVTATPLRRDELLSAAVASIARRTALTPVRSAAEPTRGDAALIAERVRRHLDDAYLDDLTTDDLSAAGSRTRYAVYRVFRAAYVMAPSDYQRQLRLRAARGLIAGGRPLTEAADATGFADQGHLTRWFGRYYGITPGDYRRAGAGA